MLSKTQIESKLGLRLTPKNIVLLLAPITILVAIILGGIINPFIIMVCVFIFILGMFSLIIIFGLLSVGKSLVDSWGDD